MRYQPLILLSIFHGEMLCLEKTITKKTGICELRDVGDDYWYSIIADFVVSKQKNVNFYNTVLTVTRVCSSEEIDAYFELVFTIAPTYCNSRVKYDTRACTPVTMEAIGKCLAYVIGDPPDQPRNVTHFACVAPDEADTSLLPRPPH
ncbi:uncharacterized protein LOC119373973 [Rhipicephalus sanguineus]|uniref:uncharacterized protein LOC119373973 n=1 Tax=Rhipicephalus sanguineus TaxID=34632 RepID=UPI001895BEDB|nr:uncharacterized protein LOC119373973 [Rhipicephalus sanguineus]